MRGCTWKTPIPTKPSHSLYTFLSPLDLRQCQLCPRRWGILGHPPERVAASVAREGEVRHVPDLGGENFGQDLEGVTASVAREGDPTKSGWLTFEPGGVSTINFRALDQESDSNKASRGEQNKSTKAIL